MAGNEQILKAKFNDYVQSLETYIMFQIKAKQLALTEELTKKNRKPTKAVKKQEKQKWKT